MNTLDPIVLVLFKTKVDSRDYKIVVKYYSRLQERGLTDTMINIMNPNKIKYR
jgi:hypothetical protein